LGVGSLLGFLEILKDYPFNCILLKVPDWFGFVIYIYIFFLAFSFIAFKIVNIEKNIVLKLCFDGLKNKRQNWKNIFGNVN
jgi:hypothetical protein